MAMTSACMDEKGSRRRKGPLGVGYGKTARGTLLLTRWRLDIISGKRNILHVFQNCSKSLKWGKKDNRIPFKKRY